MIIQSVRILGLAALFATAAPFGPNTDRGEGTARVETAPAPDSGAPSDAPAEGDASAALAESAPGSPATLLLTAIPEGPERPFLIEVLDRNPELATLEAAARGAAQRAPQVSALPDPFLALTGYIWPTETRVGPMQFTGSLSQRFPWFGKLRLREEAALDLGVAASAKLEAARLRLLTDARRLYDELAFLRSFEGIVREDRSTLVHYEELSRARYASGFGLEQSIVKIQAEITRDEARLLEIATRRASLIASMNALRDRPQASPVEAPPLPEAREAPLDLDALRQSALANRPEIVAADADIARARAMTGLARKEYAPDVTLGLSYTAVGKRTDAAGVVNPPPDNGQNILALSGALNLPIWQRKLKAGLEEALEAQYQANDQKRSAVNSIDQTLGDLLAKIPLTWQRLRLLQDVLLIQADQSLRSAEAGYSAGTLAALDLLDAERILLEVRIQASRALADYRIALAQLEGAVGQPLRTASQEEATP